MKMFSGNREAKYLKWTSSNVFLEKFTPKLRKFFSQRL